MGLCNITTVLLFIGWYGKRRGDQGSSALVHPEVAERRRALVQQARAGHQRLEPGSQEQRIAEARSYLVVIIMIVFFKMCRNVSGFLSVWTTIRSLHIQISNDYQVSSTQPRPRSIVRSCVASSASARQRATWWLQKHMFSTLPNRVWLPNGPPGFVNQKTTPIIKPLVEKKTR